jgi:hypothetical protein
LDFLDFQIFSTDFLDFQDFPPIVELSSSFLGASRSLLGASGSSRGCSVLLLERP